MKALAIDGVTPAYNPLKPFVRSKSFNTSKDFIFRDATISPVQLTSGCSLDPCIVAFMQSKGKETNQAQAPDIPPATGIVQAELIDFFSSPWLVTL